MATKNGARNPTAIPDCHSSTLGSETRTVAAAAGQITTVSMARADFHACATSCSASASPRKRAVTTCAAPPRRASDRQSRSAAATSRGAACTNSATSGPASSRAIAASVARAEPQSRMARRRFGMPGTIVDERGGSNCGSGSVARCALRVARCPSPKPGRQTRNAQRTTGNAQRLRKSGLYATRKTIFPKCSLAFMIRCASPAWSSGSTRSITGRMRPASSALAEAVEERRDDRRLVGRRARAQGRADHLQAAHQQCGEVELGARAAHEADDDQAAVDRERGDVGLEILAADAVEHDVDAGAAGRLAHRRREVAVAIVDRHVGAVLETAPTLLGAAGGHEDAQPRLATEADRGRADAAAAAVHEHASRRPAARRA